MDAPEIEQNEEVTDSADEGNSGTEGDDITNEIPSDEDPVVEEPSEGDVVGDEEPFEEEVMAPTISTYGAGDSVTVTLPEEAAQVGYTITGNATATEGEDYTFTVKPDPDYQIIAVKAKVGDDDEEPLTATATAGDGTVTYTVPTVTGAVVITVEVSKIKYTVEAEYNKAAVTLAYGAGVTGETDKVVEAGSDLTFTAEPKAGSTITGVTYTMGTTVTEPTVLTADTNDNKTYKIENVSGNVMIMIASETTYKVTFVSNANVTELTDIKIDGEAADPATLGITTSNGEVSVKEGSTLSFKVTPAEYFMVSGVKDGADKPVSKDTGDVYSLTVNAATTLTIATELDPEQCGSFTFALSEGSDKGSATAIVGMAEGETDADGIEGEIDPSDDKIITRNKKVLLSFTADPYYDLGDVTINGTVTPANVDTNNDDTSDSWKIELTAGETVAVEVATTPKDSEDPGKIQIDFDANVKNLELESVTVDGESVDKAADGTYTVDAGSTRVAIAISAEGAFKPSVSSTNDLAGEPEVTIEDNKKIYTYQFLARKLVKDTLEVFKVSEEAITYGISVAGDAANVKVSASINGRAIADNKLSEIPEGETVAITVAQKDNCTLKTVKYTVGDTEKTAKVTKGVATFTEKVTGDIEITVGAAAEYKAAALTDVTDSEKPVEIQAVKNVYSVSHTGSYTVGLTQGDSTTALPVADVQILDSKNKPVTEVVTIDGKGTTTPTIKLSAAVAGQKLTAKLFVAVAGEEEPVDTKVAYTLQVSKVVSNIKAPANAKQPTDTAKEYKVTTDGEIAKLTVTVSEESDADVIDGNPTLASDGTLTITSGQAAGTAKVVVSGGDNKSATIAVTTTALISKTTAKPTVTLKSASDVSLTLTLGAKKIDTPAKGAVYYKVVVTPQAETDTEKMPEKLKKDAQTLYFLKDGDSQSERIVVGKDDLLGSGGAWKYEVKVSLIHVKDAKVDITSNELTAEQIAAEIVKVDGGNAESQAFETGSKPFATLTPAWESNLKLKKGTTTIYTGQQNVIIATPQFSKTTTYTEIKGANITDISYPAGGNPLTGFKVNEDGTISVSATTGTAVGKHTIQVIAGANEKEIEGGKTNSMYASRATIAVTVVRGIDSLGVTVPSVSLYKATGKAATLKATPYYNGDTTGKVKEATPKTKKVTWSLVSGDTNASNEEAFDSNGKVTIKNGTVTVAKDYVLKPNDEENTFRIKVSVDNGEGTKKPQWIGSANAVYSDPITITNVGAQINTIAVVAPAEYDASWNVTKYKVVATPEKNDPEAAAINYGYVRAFKTSSLSNEYTPEELVTATVPNSNLTFKSSKAKNVAVSGGGQLTVNSPANGVKLTVTANDGSKNKAELTLNVGYDTPASDYLALQILKTDADNNIIGNWSWDQSVCKPWDDKMDEEHQVEKAYNGSAVSRVAIQVQAWKEDATNEAHGGCYEKAPRHANYTLKVKKGGKITGQDSGDSNVYYATLDKRDIEITLTNNVTKKTSTYKLTNNDIVGSSIKDAIGTKVVGTLRPAGTEDDQKVTIQLSKLDKLSITQDANTTYTAKVEIDWSKKNDKNAGALSYFANHLSKDSFEITAEDFSKGTKDLELSFDADKDNAPLRFSQSSYALKVTLYASTTGDTTTSQAATKAAAVTVKVDKVKKFTFKPTASYTIGDKDGYAVLGGKSSIPVGELNLKFTDLLNLADKNGQENHFADTFKIEGGKLMVKTDAAAADYLKDKANLTGYLEYTATTDKEYYDNKGAVKQLAKITVKVNDKAVVKYTNASTDSIANKQGQTAEVQILVNSKDAMELKAVSVASALLKSTKDPIAYKEIKDGKLVLEMTDNVEVPAKGKKVSADLYIVPSDSKHVGKFVGVGVTPSEQDYKDYAATVKVTLNVTELQAEEMTVTEAETKVKAWKDEVANADPKPSWLTNSDATDATMKDAVLAAVTEYVNAAAPIVITLDENETFTFKKAEVGVTGQVAGTIKISNGTADDDKTVTFDFEIPALPDTSTPTATVTGVVIKKGTDIITKDEVTLGTEAVTVTYTAEVEGTNLADTDKGVTWSLEGSVDNKSSINNGTLTIGAEETATELEVKATSEKDPEKSTTVTVTVNR